MKKRKFKIIYDTTIISSGLYKDANRSGIFFVAYNILMELMRREKVEVGFYCQDFYKGAVTEFFRLKSINEWGINPDEWEPVHFVERDEIEYYDAFFSPVFKTPDEIRSCKSIKSYVLLHDAIPFLYKEYYPQIDTDYWLKDLLDTMGNDETYFTDSVNTKKDFSKLRADISEEKFVPVQLSYDNSMFEGEITKKELFEKYGLAEDQQYFLSLCSIQPRKNVKRIVRTFIQFINKNKIEDTVLVLAGAKDEDVYEKLEISRDNPYIKVLGYVEDNEKRVLYENAKCFVYTSQYEGFGMPPLEAMACGCPVISSNNSSLPEVMGDAGIMIDWDSDEQHINAYESMYEACDEDVRNQARKRAKEFSWSKSVDCIMEKMLKVSDKMRLNIGWDATAIYGPMSKNRGIGNYVTGLLSTMIDIDEANHYYLFNMWENTSFSEQLVHKERLSETYIYCGKNNDLLTNNDFEQIFANALRRFLDENQIDVFFITSPFESRMFPYKKEWFGDVQTVTIVYDVIPYLFKERYFDNDIEKNGRWYLDRLNMINDIDKSLAISESARQDLIDVLKLPENRVDTIWGAVDRKFVVLSEAQKKHDVLDKFGITDKYIMCTGGDDERKNLAGLIEAYSDIDRKLIEEYQLVIVCKLSEGSFKRYTSMAIQRGIEGRVVLTGFVTDEELVQLYNMASLVAFPSEYEGFGLPIVEAFACDTPVLTSNNSSLVEVAGDAAILVDPFSVESVADGITKALTETNLDELVERGRKRVEEFQWEKVAKSTLRAIVNVPKLEYPGMVQKIAMFTPLPPLYSGIADYSRSIIVEMSKRIDIDVYIDDGYEATELGIDNVRVFNHREFEARVDEYDEVVYQLGNSQFHIYMWEYLRKYHGTIVLHDYNMHGVLNYLISKTGDYVQYGKYLMEDFASDKVTKYISKVERGIMPLAIHEVHANGFLCNYADKIIVHSQFNERLLLNREVDRNIFCIKHFAKINDDYDKNTLRRKYGYKEDEIIIASFGIVASTKRICETIEGIADILKSNDKVRYLVVGGDVSEGKSYTKECVSVAKMCGVADKIQYLGFVEEDVMVDYMELSDICINLRHPYGGESSGSFARLLGMGKAVVVNKVGDFDEVCDEACIKIPAVDNLSGDQEKEAIRDAVSRLMNNDYRLQIEKAALEYAKSELDISKIVDEYIRCFNTRVSNGKISESISKISGTELANKNYTDNEVDMLLDTIMYGQSW